MNKLEKEMATHCSILAGRVLLTEEPGGLRTIGSQGVSLDRSDLAVDKTVISHYGFNLHFCDD